MSNRYENPTEEKKKLILLGRSSLTLIRNYDFELGSITSIDDVNPKKIDTIIPLKSKTAIGLLGDWGKGGVVWVFMKCQE